MALIFQDPKTGEWKVQGPKMTQFFGQASTSPMIQPPAMNPITPPQQQIPGLSQINEQPQIPMPGQLGSMARQSVLAQNNLLGDNWSSMF